MNGDHTERLPQEGKCRNENESGILEDASTFAQRVLEEIEALAGTTACKSVQLVRLKQWAQEHCCWFDDRTQFGDFFDRGSENEVYLSPDGTEIIKLNDFRYSDDNLTPFFEHIKAHNKYFDAVDGNVLVDDDGHLYFIDTIIFKSNTGGLDTYNSLSPRASKKYKLIRYS